MRTDILFKDIRRSDYIENFVGDKIDQLIDRLVSWDADTHITVRLEKAKERTALRHPVYQCELTIKSGESPCVHKTVRADRNVFRAIVAAFTTMKQILAKQHDRLHKDRRRRRVPEYVSVTPPVPV
jgi:ribosome-associated translation inhibitor RaiA